MAAHPSAPGDLELVRAFVNTLDVEGGTDALSAPAGLAEFYAGQSLLGSSQAVSDADLRTAVAIRDALRGLLKANHGEPPDEAAVRELNQAFIALPLTLRLARDGSLSLEPAEGGAGAALARLIAIVFRSMAEGTWPRLKICRSDACQWAFFDHSRNRSGSWCSMAVCGNRTKVRRFQARARASKRAADREP
jgi:predicted RNA-binding Zn ribbon-like protein